MKRLTNLDNLLRNSNEDTIYYEKNRIIIRPKMYDKFLKAVHTLSGHRRMRTCYYNIKNFYNIKGIRKNIKRVIETCRTCLRVKNKSFKTLDKNNNIIATEKLEQVSTDIYRPLNWKTFNLTLRER